ncbi:MAG TPA: hypothetical protein VF400_01070 [Anaeromyxobacteraceae bacterium]
MTLRTSAVLAMLLLRPAPAVAAPEAFRCEKRGGSHWREYRSEHFAIDTDLAPEDTRRLAQELEELHALELQALVSEVVEIPGRVRVVALRDPRQFQDLADDRFAAYQRATATEEIIVLQSKGLKVSPEMVGNTVALHLSEFLFPRRPWWFGMGLAYFVQTAAVPRKSELAKTGTLLARTGAGASGGRWVGLAPAELARDVRTLPLMPVRDLFSWHGQVDAAVVRRPNLSSWVLYHYLWNKQSRQFSEYQRRLSDGEAPASAWRAAFPEYDPGDARALEKLDGELDRYRRGGRFTSYEVPLPSLEVRLEEAPLSTADLHVIMARARFVDSREAVAQYKVELDEALAEDPQHPEALGRRAQLDRKPTPDALRAAVKARPADWRAWYYLAQQLEAGDPAEREASYRKAVALGPDAAAPHNALSWLLAESGRPREALPFANRAVDLAPWNPAFVDTLAIVARELGQCPQALQLARRAMEAGAGGELGRVLARHEEETRRRCDDSLPSSGSASAVPVPERP